MNQAVQPPLPPPPTEEVIVEWDAPQRPFKKRNRQYYVTVTALVFLVSLILFLAGQFLFIAVILAFAFVNYVLSSVPPSMVHNKITTYGIYADTAMFHWEDMRRFWLSEKYGEDIVHIEINKFPHQLSMLLGGQIPKEDMTELLSQVLRQEKPPATAYDKAAKWLQENIPLEK